MYGNLEENVAAVLALLLHKDIAAGDTVEKSSEAAWDSMKHIEIILTLEEKFNISFDPEDIPHLTSMGMIIAKIKSIYGK